MVTAMSDWMQFCEGLDFGRLVPNEAEEYRSVIVDSLGYFLENLPRVRTIEILAEQAAMPSDTGIDERLVAIARHCPSLHKLGQVLARDRRLSPRFRRLLQSLESMRPTQSLSLVRTALERELGPLSKLGVTLGESPLAEASVAVVIPFTLRDGRHGERRRGVFKLLKSGIEEKLGEELDLLRRVGAFLQDRCRMYGLPNIDYESSFEQVAELLALETHLDREQQTWRRPAPPTRT
jgi:ubiquinone biosynthesis protein